MLLIIPGLLPSDAVGWGLGDEVLVIGTRLLGSGVTLKVKLGGSEDCLQILLCCFPPGFPAAPAAADRGGGSNDPRAAAAATADVAPATVVFPLSSVVSLL